MIALTAHVLRRTRIPSILLLILACVFALVPAFHFHDIAWPARGPVAVQTATFATVASLHEGRTAEIRQAAESECLICAAISQPPLRVSAPLATSSRLPVDQYVGAAQSPSLEGFRTPAQPRAPPGLA